MKTKRVAEIKRKTKETDIQLSINLDGSGKQDINTGIGFFNHMLELFCYHGGLDLRVKCSGDLMVDGHHSVEDIGIVLGKAIAEALGDKKGIARYAHSLVPMDESLSRCVLDISGRPFLVFNGGLKGKVGDFDLELLEEFFRAVSTYGMLTVHIEVLYGSNTHHIAEACFKAFARALKMAVRVEGKTIPSTKGVLE